MLLKGRGPGGIAPAFLNLGSDLDDESSPSKNTTIPISTSVDSDDDGKFIDDTLLHSCMLTQCLLLNTTNYII